MRQRHHQGQDLRRKPDYPVRARGDRVEAIVSIRNKALSPSQTLLFPLRSPTLGPAEHVAVCREQVKYSLLLIGYHRLQ